MRFINQTKIFFFTLLLAALLSACGATPEMADVEEELDQELVEGEAGAEALKFSFDLTGPAENPYLLQEVSVPGAASALFRDALAAMQSQQWSRAENLFLQLNAQYPNLSGPYLNLGIVYRQLNKIEDAEKALAKAISVNELNIYALNQLALLKREQGDFKAAETLYLNALAIWPRHDSSHKNLGILYDMYMGDFDRAVEHFEVYQYLQAEPIRQVAGWIVDLKRRISNLQAGAQP